ncbi:MAG: hypothetical protein GY771_14765 [bacterium]|nr:hypothetical protein [bacterium]
MLFGITICILPLGDVSIPPIYDAVTAATSPPDESYETVVNLMAEIHEWREWDFDGGCTPYEDIELTWEPTSDGQETGYEIWATTTTGVFERIDTIDADATEYTDYFINMYYEEVEVIQYRIRPLFGGQPGPFCEAVSVKNPGYIEPVR